MVWLQPIPLGMNTNCPLTNLTPMTNIRKTLLQGSFVYLACLGLAYAAVQSGGVLAEGEPSHNANDILGVLVLPGDPPPPSASSTSFPASPPPSSPSSHISIDLTTIVVGTMAIGFAFATTKQLWKP